MTKVQRDRKENAVDIAIGRIFAAIVLVGIAALALFALQNRQPVQIHFLWYDGARKYVTPCSLRRSWGSSWASSRGRRRDLVPLVARSALAISKPRPHLLR